MGRQSTGIWCDLTQKGGRDVGILLMPNIGGEVVVGFEQGDVAPRQ